MAWNSAIKLGWAALGPAHRSKGHDQEWCTVAMAREDEGAVNEESAAGSISQAGMPGSGNREQDAIYQNGKVVGRVVEPDIDLEAKEIRFDEIADSDHLVLADECEFQKYRIMIQKIAFATKVDHRPGRNGRTLAGCTAEILGYIEQ